MTPDGIREYFEVYRKVFRNLLVKHFLNLPVKYQERFLVLIETFMKDCKRVYNESKEVKEKTIRVRIERILPPDNQAEEYIVCGKTEGVSEEIRMAFPSSKPRPDIGKSLIHTMYSIDGSVWYSSKEQLLTGRRST